MFNKPVISFTRLASREFFFMILNHHLGYLISVFFPLISVLRELFTDIFNGNTLGVCVLWTIVCICQIFENSNVLLSIMITIAKIHPYTFDILYLQSRLYV